MINELMVWEQDESTVSELSNEDTGLSSTWDEDNLSDNEAMLSVAEYEVSHSITKGKGKDKAKKGKRRVGTKFFERPTVSLDTEYTESPCGTYNRILSYQFVVRHEGKSSGIILYPESTKKSGRLALDKCLVLALEKAMAEDVLTCWPTDIILVAHFLKADLFNFSNAFDQLKTHVKGLRKTVASLDEPYGLDLDEVLSRRIDKEPLEVYDKTRNYHTLYITFYDSMLLSPNGKSLADVGRLVGLPKLDIPAPYSISRMDEYRDADPEGYAAYAMNDGFVTSLHFERISKFCKDIGLKSVPFTIGGIAVKAFVNGLADSKGYRQLFGFMKVTKEVWPEDRNKPLTLTRDVPVTARMTLENFATQAYSGGRNESFIAGSVPIDTWNDFDAPSCYTAICLGLRKLAYDRMFMTKKLEDLFGDKCALAWVRFEFPASTRFPSLAVRSDKGLIFPLTGETHCTGHELEVASNQGAIITIKQAFVIPWADDVRIFENFMGWVRENRQANVKGGFEERLFKEIGNTLYGKFSQSLRPKTAFDIQAGYSKQLPPSTLTNPFFAAYTTGLARALMGEMVASIPDHRTVVSLTTDGMATNATLEEFDLNGPICQRFREHFHRIDPNGGEILELKHQAKQLIGAKTRAQYTVLESEGFAPILAKGGVMVARSVVNQSAYMVDLYLNRHVGQLTDGSHLTSTREMFIGRKDMMNEQREILLNMEYDHKRELIDPVMIDVKGQRHISLQSKPHHSLDDMLFTRLRFDRWRKNNCLKTMDDWITWHDRLAMAKASKNKSVNLKKDETSGEYMARLFLRFYGYEHAGIRKSDINATQLALWLTEQGYPTKAAAVRGAGRSDLVEGAVPLTELTIKFAKLLVAKFPNFNPERLFEASSRPQLREALKQ
ncbi:DNA-directed DNA polymerase [Moritella sp. PE36]|uniref:hypothetical protein n=1 Tax=Moritella sp. PE36 TaxID=58051 RepID=UPI00015689C5|nr:hypothetical protein [Moritella sp. PE36]EDM69284.1 DNA-directed DNA polymerase [Moritella sp. PE36]